MPEIDLGYVLGPKGDPGEPGRDGTDGTPGAPGAPGANGKSAYQYAKEGGFVGTEEQFYTALAEVILKMNKVIPRKVDTIATLSAAGQAQDSGKTLADYYTKGETVAKGDVYTKSEVYSKTEADGKFAGTDKFYTKDQTMTAATGQLFGSGIQTPNQAFAAIKQLFNETESETAEKATVIVGSRTGGGSTSVRLSFSSKPKLVIYLSETESSAQCIYIDGATKYANGSTKFEFTQSGNSLTIRETNGKIDYSGSKYVYFAII